MKIGISIALYNDQPLEKTLEYVSSVGYQAIEIPCWKGINFIDIDKIVKGEALAYKKTVKKYGLTISALSNHLEGQYTLGPYDSSTDEWFKGSAEEKSKHAVERIKKTVEAAAALDVPVITTFTGVPEWGRWYTYPQSNMEVWQSYLNLFKERWLPILDYADSHGIKLAFETHPEELNYNVDTAKVLLKLVDNHKAMGFNYDPSHLLWQQMDPVQAVYEFNKRIFHVHAKDVEIVRHSASRTGVLINTPQEEVGRAVRFRTVGWGDVPWKKVITALLEIGYNNVLSVEHEDPCLSRKSGVEQAIYFLKPLVNVEPAEMKPWW